ncbi:MAG: DUF5067 domain-containing protein, partial [Lactobacillaceae bacterium]|nr:DUF5067 domain-containing protein [Lactobacillaceae bacterium]
SSTSSQKATSNFVFDADKREFSTNDYKVKITGFSFQANTVVASKSMLMMQYDFTNTSGEEIRPNEIMTDHVEVLSDGNQLEWGDLLVLDENSTNFSTLENNGIRFVEPGNTTHAQIHYSVPKGSTSDFQIVIKNGSKTVGTINLTRGELGQ